MHTLFETEIVARQLAARRPAAAVGEQAERDGGWEGAIVVKRRMEVHMIEWKHEFAVCNAGFSYTAYNNAQAHARGAPATCT